MSTETIDYLQYTIARRHGRSFEIANARRRSQVERLFFLRQRTKNKHTVLSLQRYTASMIGLEVKQDEKEPKAPEFIMPLEDITVDEGDNAKFMVKVDGHPRPRVTWSINDSDIFNVSMNLLQITVHLSFIF
jgi:hypothetical protein